ncbi:hypothetical protein [Roseburia sp. AM16-25]|uniref:hypothetical protein n=1 Tax=Roseburia sp. AM16-25 TaxID=2292065 RepID=UPI000E4F1560|nr:hypothetical protein [Roseburia sp. AM16-25]RHO29697.1 hypothetical protein DW183_11585 [Roseburia sp. AM16-25]
MTESTDPNTKARMYTHHGRKKNQGKWAMVNNVPALAYTENLDGSETVVGYTTITEIIAMAYAKDLPVYQVDF